MSAAIRHRTAGLSDRVERLEAVAEAAEHTQATPGLTALLYALMGPDGYPDAVLSLAARMDADALTDADVELLATAGAPADDVAAYIRAAARILSMI